MNTNKHHGLSNFLFPSSVDELFQQFWGEPTRAGTWRPAIDVQEDDDAYVVTVELPGVDVADLELTLTADTLTIEGDKQAVAPAAGKGRQDHLKERRFGRFARSFTFPAAVAADQVEAESRAGVLTVTVKKAAGDQTRRIEIRSA